MEGRFDFSVCCHIKQYKVTTRTMAHGYFSKQKLAVSIQETPTDSNPKDPYLYYILRKIKETLTHDQQLFCWSDIALSVSDRTLRRRQHEFGMRVKGKKFSSPLAADLDAIITNICAVMPRQQGLVVQRVNVLHSLRRVDPVMSALRNALSKFTVFQFSTKCGDIPNTVEDSTTTGSSSCNRERLKKKVRAGHHGFLTKIMEEADECSHEKY
ncbi:unnamed protein product [Porites evermanni]|uniref:Uncharacterized protein n=1 Tax=Porites evermanni TaxID=104178 RepID=A0ABN8RZJ7_9CNID|nr:unnamed protein product [Porites evermanni]